MAWRHLEGQDSKIGLIFGSNILEGTAICYVLERAGCYSARRQALA
jgi:hypothetical protein